MKRGDVRDRSGKNYGLRGALIAIVLGVIGWGIFFSGYDGECSNEACLINFFLIVTSLLSLIGLWLVGLLIGSLFSHEKKPWYFYSPLIIGIIIIFSIIKYIFLGL